jgi:hypothetical protein
MKQKIFILLLVLICGYTYSQVPNPPVLNSPPNNSTGLHPDSVLLNWSDVTGALSYRVQVSLNSGFTAIVIDENPTNSQYPIQPGMLSSLTFYYWHVNVTTTGGTSNWSAAFNFTTRLGSPQAPILIIPPNGATGVSIHPMFDWNSVPGATGYIIHVSKSPLFDSLVVNDTTPIGTITLQYSTTYYWRMCAFNGGSTGNWSSVFNFTTTSQVPDPPVLISPPDSSVIPVTGQTFDWSDVPTATSYRIQISMSSNFGTTFLNTVTTSSQYTHYSPAFQYGILYYWRVNATGPSGTSQWSSVWRVITSVALPLPPSLYPVNRGKPVYVDSATIFDWSHVATATSYRIQIATSSGFPNPIINEVVYDTLFIAPPYTFSNYTVYYWRVNASNSGGQGPWSASWNFTVMPGVPNPPTLISPANNSTNISLTPILKWLKTTGAINYRVQVSASPSFSNLIINTSLLDSLITIPPGKLSLNTKYYWRVNTSNSGGTSNWSDVWSFTTLNQIGISQISSEIPSEYKLYQNYPNPFNPSTIIRFQIKDLRLVTLKIYNILGKEVSTLINEKLSPGKYEATFDGSLHGQGSNLLSGIYYYTIRAGDFSDTKRMVLIK